jgi:DNA-binding XRE family transcriptional regulator
MPTYRLRWDNVLLHKMIDRDIKPTGSGLGKASGLPATTINQLRAGRPPSATTMAALVRVFDCKVEDIFRAAAVVPAVVSATLHSTYLGAAMPGRSRPVIETVNGKLRLICDNPDHLRGWIYPPTVYTENVVREFARHHGWSVDQAGRDLCPTCTRKAVS